MSVVSRVRSNRVEVLAAGAEAEKEGPVLRPPTPSPRERDAVLRAIREGRPPDLGHRFVVAGRDEELRHLGADVDRVTRGVPVVRVLLGPSGSGTTFLLGATRSVALDRRLVTGTAELGRDVWIHGERGQTARLYRAVVASLATRVHPEGALPRVLERLTDVATAEARAVGIDREVQLRRRLSGLASLPAGAAYGAVVLEACRAPLRGDGDAGADALAWLAGEPEAGHVIRIPPTLSDLTAWDHLRLLARVCRLAGFGGLLVLLDHVDRIARLRRPESRAANLARLAQLAAAEPGAGLGVILAGASEPFDRLDLLPASLGEGLVLRVAPLSPAGRRDLLDQVSQLHGHTLEPALLAALEARHLDLGDLLRALVRALDLAPRPAQRVAVKVQEREVQPKQEPT